MHWTRLRTSRRTGGSALRTLLRWAVALLVGTALLAGGLAGPSQAAAGSHAAQRVRAEADPATPTEVDWLRTDLGRYAWLYRKSHKISSGRNVAVFEYVDSKGNVQLKAMASGESANGGGHSERNIINWLKDKKIPLDNVRRVYSDLEPCEIPGGFCKKAIANELKNVKEVTYAVKYRGDKASRAQGVKQLRRFVAQTRAVERRLRKAFQKAAKKCAAQNLSMRQEHGSLGSGIHILLAAQAAAADPCDGGDDNREPSGIAQEMSDPGGIDFSTMQLRYLSDPGDGSGLQYSFSAGRSAAGDTRTDTGLAAADVSSDAFFVWLSLNPSAFWVNLNPDEPDRIVDERLGSTDAGRIMLEADLLMKKTVGKLIHPDTELGKQFWDGVSGNCMSFRSWILPTPAKVHQDGDKLYIVDAPLDVKMETQYLKQHGKASARSCPQQDKATEDRNEQHFRTLILPRLKNAINTAPEYADLRRVYLSRVAAEWYRDLSRTKHTTYGDLIDNGDVADWRTTTGWKPTDTFDRFVDSYTKGEFKVTHRTRSGNTVYTRTYVYGGVDLTRIPFDKVTGERFRAEQAGLAKTVDQSLNSPSAFGKDDTMWLGSPTPRQASQAASTTSGSSVGEGGGGLSSGDLALRVGLPSLVVLLAAALWWRRRQLSTSATASPLRRAAVPDPHSRDDSSQWL